MDGDGGEGHVEGKLVELEAGSKVEHNNNHHHHHHHGTGHPFFRQLRIVGLLFGVIIVTCFVLYRSAYPFQFLPQLNSYNLVHASSPPNCSSSSSSSDKGEVLTLKDVLENAATFDNTVIITTLNEAWAAPGSIFDLFLESFRGGSEIVKLLRHLVVVAVDQKAYDRCLAVHPHCYILSRPNHTLDSTGDEAYFGTPDYLELMWARINLLRSILELRYNFIFTDADIMWFHNPFPHFYLDADFQIACDVYKGDPSDLTNSPNGGFTYVKSNDRTIEFYKFWYNSRIPYPGRHDQDVLNIIKSDPFINDIGLKIKFLDTRYFGGFCQPSRDLNEVCTMHANCCCGLQNKIYDLSILLEDWRKFLSLKANGSTSQPATSWTVPQKCIDSYHPPDSPKKKTPPPPPASMLLKAVSSLYLEYK